MRRVIFCASLGVLGVLGGYFSPVISAANINDDVVKYVNAPRAFPTWESAKPIDGALVEVDVIHRTGIFREDGSGTLRSFVMPANGVVGRLGVEGDLRDVPLATHGCFFLLPDTSGALTQLGALLDDVTNNNRSGVAWTVEAVDVKGGRITVQPLKSGGPMLSKDRFDFITDGSTRFHIGEGDGKLTDIAVGERLLVNRIGDGARQLAYEVWIGDDASKRAVTAQRKSHLEFLKVRGLPAWVEAVDGKNLVLIPFALSDIDLLTTMQLADINPVQWATEHRGTAGTVVTNQQLRSYNPPVDRAWGNWVAWQPVAAKGIGHGGHRLTVSVNNLLEGFRPGEVVRVFVRDNWKVEDMPFGEGIYDHIWESPEIDPGAYPYRTDFCNEHLPWYKLQPGRLPPGESAHQRWGDLIELAADGRSGRFRDELTGRTESFVQPPFGVVWAQGAEAELSELPIGTRCCFALHQDAQGAFTVASTIRDEFTVQKQRRLTARVIAVRADRGEIHVAWQLPKEKNYDDDWVTPPDTGSAMLPVDATTKLWKGDQTIALTDLAIGDLIQVNRTGATVTTLARCTHIWVGEATITSLADRQRTKHQEASRRVGVPALVENINGRLVTMVCIGGDRDAFRDLLRDDPWGKPVHIQVVDERLKPRGTPQQVGFNNNIKEGDTVGCYGAAGRHWIVDCQMLPEGLTVGGYLRVFNNGWPLPE